MCLVLFQTIIDCEIMNSSWMFALLPIIGGLVVWYIQSSIEKYRKAEERLHDSRRKAYLDILEPYILSLSGIKKPQYEEEALRLIASVEYKRTAFELNMIADDEVVKAFNEYMQYFYTRTEENQLDYKVFLTNWGNLILQIRKSVGDPKTKLTPKDMLRSTINDIDTLT